MWRGKRQPATPVCLTLLLLLLGGCASTPAPQPETAPDFTPIPPVSVPVEGEAGESDEPPPQTEPRQPEPEQQPPALCAWSKTRGVASLLAVEEGTGTWQFFPGDDIVFKQVPSGAGAGAEYRAILERPLNGPCDRERLILVAPL